LALNQRGERLIGGLVRTGELAEDDFRRPLQLGNMPSEFCEEWIFLKEKSY